MPFPVTLILQIYYNDAQLDADPVNLLTDDTNYILIVTLE
jgi:hypothetical protein